MKRRYKLIGLLCVFSLITSCFPLWVNSEKASQTEPDVLKKIFSDYVRINRNNSVKSGLLELIQDYYPQAEISDDDFAVYYSQPTAYDTDKLTGYPLNIPGNDGAVAAKIHIGNETFALACTFEREKEELPATNVAVAGADDGKLIYDSSNNVIGCAEGVDKIVIPAGYNGTMGKPDFTSYPAMNSVKTVIIQNTSKIISEAFKGEGVNWASLKALNIYGGKVTYWQTFDGFFVNACVWGCPALKYLYMPTDTTKNFPKYSFRDLTALETVNVPFGSWYDWGCLYNNGIREYITTGKLANGNWSSASFNDGSLSGGKTVSVIKETTEITAVRAAAWISAALNEQADREDGDAMISAAKETLKKRAWNQSSYDCFSAAAVELNNDWYEETAGKETKTAEISIGDTLFSARLVKIDAEKLVLSAMKEYVAESGNSSEKAGLLAAVRNEIPYTDISEYEIYYAQPSAYDKDSVSGYPLNIPGNDGGVAAIFILNGQKLSYVCAYSREREEVPSSNVAVAGANDGKLIYDSLNNIIGCVDGVDKIVVPEGYSGTVGKPDFEKYPAMNCVKTVIIANRVNIPKNAFNNWKSLKALDLYGGKSLYWHSAESEKEFLTYAAVSSCYALKYLYLPIDTYPSWFASNSFYNLPALKTANIPVSTDYFWGAFKDTGVKEFVLGGKNSNNNWSSAIRNESDSFNGTETKSLITSTTVLTDVRAAAWGAAALNEQRNARSNAAALTGAKSALRKRAWNEETYKSFDRLSVAFLGTWEYMGNGLDNRKISVKTDSASFTGYLVSSRVKPQFEMKAGATVRSEEHTGLRFATEIMGFEELNGIGAVYSFGTLVVPEDYLYTNEFTAAALTADEKSFLEIPQSVWSNSAVNGSAYTMTAVISSILPENYNRVFKARAYADVTYTDGVSVRYYSDTISSAAACKVAAEMLSGDTPITDEKLSEILNAYNAYYNEKTVPAIKNTFKTYINPETELKAAEVLPSVGYTANGAITDTMFDSFIILPSPVNSYSQQRQSDYISYLKTVYKYESNLNALESAAGTVGRQLRKTGYKINIFLPIFLPKQSVTDFGDNIDCSTAAGRSSAVKWMIDKNIEVFDSYHFANLNLAGFYWYDESINTDTNGALVKSMNTYIHSLGMKSVWSSFYKADGYSSWKTLGFDFSAMQSNYFPGSPGLPNAGSKDRLSQNAVLVKRYGMGTEPELANISSADGIKGFKETMQAGINYSTMGLYHIYYIDSGPDALYTLYTDKRSYYNSVYAELYMFIKGTLKNSSISFS